MTSDFKKFKPSKDKIYYCSKEVFKPEKGSAIRVNDARNRIPFLFKCRSCKQSEIDLSSLDFMGGDRCRISVEHNNKQVYEGMAPWLIQCSFCKSIYHIENGYREPNNGRDVITLNRIFEINELTLVKKWSTIKLPKRKKGEFPRIIQFPKILSEVTIDTHHHKLAFTFESLTGFSELNSGYNLDVFVRHENEEEVNDPVIKSIVEELTEGLEVAIKREEHQGYQIVGSLGVKFSNIRLEQNFKAYKKQEVRIGGEQFFRQILEKNRVQNSTDISSPDIIIKDVLKV